MSSFSKHAGLEAAKASGNVNIAGATRVEVMDLSAASLEEQAKYQASIRQFEIKRRARSVVVPTAIADVKLALREMGLPITLFAEGPYDRRERLREAIADAEMRRGGGAANGAVVGDGKVSGQAAGERKAAQEVFYSSASDVLLAARQVMADHSFACSKARLASRSLMLSSPPALAAEDARAAQLYTCSSALQLDSTAVAEQRPLVNMRYSPHGGLLATGSLGCNISLWGSTNLQTVASLTREGHKERITALAWHPAAFLQQGAALLATASADGKCLLWDCKEHAAAENSGGAGAGALPIHAPCSSLSCGLGGVADCAFHPCGHYLAAACGDHSWRLFDVETAVELQLQDGHTKDCTALSFQPDGSLLMTCDATGVVLLWDLRSGQQVHAFRGHMEKVTSCTFNANGFVAGTSVGTVSYTHMSCSM